MDQPYQPCCKETQQTLVFPGFAQACKSVHALSIISFGSSYSDNIINLNLDSLKNQRDNLCETLFEKLVSNKEQSLTRLSSKRTNRFRNSYLDHVL